MGHFAAGQDAANEPIKGVDEFTDAWQPSTDTALVGLAVAVLEPADQEAFFATLAQDRESIAALHALADRYQEASDVGERAREWVLRASIMNQRPNAPPGSCRPTAAHDWIRSYSAG